MFTTVSFEVALLFTSTVLHDFLPRVGASGTEKLQVFSEPSAFNVYLCPSLSRNRPIVSYVDQNYLYFQSTARGLCWIFNFTEDCFRLTSCLGRSYLR